jgi:multidrug efflux pump subunit AcrB
LKSPVSTPASKTTNYQLVPGERAIYLGIQKQPGTNVVAVVEAVRAPPDVPVELHLP